MTSRKQLDNLRYRLQASKSKGAINDLDYEMAKMMLDLAEEEIVEPSIQGFWGANNALMHWNLNTAEEIIKTAENKSVH